MEVLSAEKELMEERFERGRWDWLTKGLRVVMNDLLARDSSAQWGRKRYGPGVAHQKVMLGIFKDHVDALIFQNDLFQRNHVLA